MLTLYHNDMSVCSQKVRVCLAEKGLPWEDRHIVLRDGEHQQDWYLKLNRRSVVPTLVDGDKVIPESNVILEYLEETYPAPRLSPNNSFGRAQMRLWTKQLDEDVHDGSTAVISFGIAYRHQYLERGEAGRKMLEKIPNLFKRERRRDVIEKGRTPCISLWRSSAWCSSSTRWRRLLASDVGLPVMNTRWPMLPTPPTCCGLNTSAFSTWWQSGRAWPTGMVAASRDRASPRRCASGRTPNLCH